MSIVSKTVLKIFNKIDPAINKNARILNRKFLAENVDVIDISSKEKNIKKTIKNIFKSLYIGLDKNTVKYLESLSKNDFLNESYKILINKMEIPAELAPEIAHAQIGKGKMGYDFVMHKIFINETLKATKPKIFAMLGHEVQHCKQNFNILRAEDFGEKAIQEYSKILTNATTENFIKTFKEIPEEELIKLRQSGQLSDIAFIFIKKLKAAQKMNDKTAIGKFTEELYNHDYPINLNVFKDWRAEVINKLGIIKADTKEAKDAKEYFSAFMQSMNKTKGNDYYFALSEMEAYEKQFALYIEYLKTKFGK